MKNLMYLLVAVSLCVFAACGGGETANEETTTVEVSNEVSTCADDCAKACCLGCKATEGDAKCIVLENGSMPCCIVKAEANCCCGDETCDGACHGDAADAEEAHAH
jgi:hypothetical protein